MFQSTHPHGVRHSVHKELKSSDHVSIHAPAWGATKSKTMSNMVIMFQSTHPHGVRPQQAAKPDVLPSFQSTHPHGVRPENLKELLPWQKVSIHAPAWGATDMKITFISHYFVSIHAPAWGATGGIVTLKETAKVSIHAPAWGATLSSPMV